MDLTSTSKVLLLAAVLAASATARAQTATTMSYTYVEGGYINTEIDDGIDIDGDGVGVAGSVALSDMFFLHGAFAIQEFDGGIDLNQFEIGLGGHYPLGDNLDVVGTISYLDAELDVGPVDVSDNGIGLSVGLRSRLAEFFELEGSINYADLDDTGDDTSLGIGGRFYIQPELALGVGVDIGDDATTWSVGVRYEFR